MYSGNVKTYIEYTGRENCDLRHLAEGAAKGLCYLHTFDPPIVHSDLKGCNVMVDRRGNACLTDFGISRSNDTRQGAYFLWKFGNYAHGSRHVYAFACVLYKIYTGGIPYHGENIIDCLRERKRPLLHGLGEPITRLIERCWHRDSTCKAAPESPRRHRRTEEDEIVSIAFFVGTFFGA
ncbi:kinase-like domain-containing protein [Suillus variegatus]|nr:kinase-like domain-containing protein [Suillus variegatus]